MDKEEIQEMIRAEVRAALSEALNKVIPVIINAFVKYDHAVRESMSERMECINKHINNELSDVWEKLNFQADIINDNKDDTDERIDDITNTLYDHGIE